MEPIVGPPRKDLFSRIEIQRQPIQAKSPRRMEPGTWLDHRIVGTKLSSDENTALHAKVAKSCVQSDTGGTCSALVHNGQVQHTQLTSCHCYTLTPAVRTGAATVGTVPLNRLLETRFERYSRAESEFFLCTVRIQ